MPVRLVPPSRNAAAEYMMKLFAETEQKLIREIARKRVQGYVDYAETAALTRVRRTLQEMVDKSGKYVPLAVEKEFYRDSAKHAAGYANARGMIQNPASTLAIEQLSDNLLGQVQEMAVTSYQSAAFLLGRPEADVFRELGIRNAAQVMALGKGALTATEAFVAQIEAHGITAFVDKAGRRWSLRAYGNMAVRTTVRQAQVSAVLTRDDHDLYKIVRHRAPCEVCAVYADRIYSKSGTNPNYPPLAQAFGKMDVAGPDELSNTFLNIHPNCLCTLVPWTELGKTPEEIQKARDRSSFEKNPADKEYRGKKEIEEYRQKERNRAELMRELKEWRAMRAAGISGVPGDFATFRKHYGDEVYQQWREAFKPFRPKPVPKPKAPTSPVVTTAPVVGTTTAPVGTTTAPNPQPVKRPIPGEFVPAKTIDEANAYAAQYVDPNTFGALGVDFKGVSVEVANELNRTIGAFYNEYDVPPFGGIIAPAGNTKHGKLIQSAKAAYSPVRKSFLINRKTMHDLKTANLSVQKERDIVTDFLNNPGNYDTSKASKAVLQVMNNSRVSGRATVPETVPEMIQHELGHALEKPLNGVENYDVIKSNMGTYAEKISGYATADFSEYVAESFASYCKGEHIIDPELEKAFLALRRK